MPTRILPAGPGEDHVRADVGVAVGHFDDGSGPRPPVPILRMFDVDATIRFYVDYLGCTLEWREAAATAGLSRGLPGAAHPAPLLTPRGRQPGPVLVVVEDFGARHTELRAKGYPYLNPGIEPHGVGIEMVWLDPASNQLRFSTHSTV
jgi:catechol 2,3-dioxygenase-like lactoylglutathione lyase family enzyme